MKHSSEFRVLSLALLAVLCCTMVTTAHPGHGVAGWRNGLAHPLGGLDHALAMIAVGLLAAGFGRRWVLALPAGFVGSMLLGAGLGTAGLLAPSWLVESGIDASVVTLGLLISLGTEMPVVVVAILATLFGLCHGAAHAAEIPAGSSLAAFFAGFTLSTILLHAVGIEIEMLVGRRGEAATVRLFGVAISVCGVMMLDGVL